MEILQTILSSEAVWSLVGTVIVALLGWGAAILKKKGLEVQAVDTLKNAVTLTQEKFVTFAKRASQDGKLTPEERQQARDLAIEEAKNLAVGPVKDILLSWSKPKLEALIGRIVRTNQAEGQKGN